MPNFDLLFFVLEIQAYYFRMVLCWVMRRY